MSDTHPNYWLDNTAEKIFNSIDTNNDGSLSRDEMKRSLQANQIPITEKILDSIFETSDLNNDGSISLDEFKSFTKRQTDKLKEVFFEYDNDNSGYLTRTEIKQLILKIDKSYEDYYLDKMVNRLDTNKDGQIDFHEFMQFYHMIPINNIRMTFDYFSKEGIDIGESFTIPNESDDDSSEKGR